MAKRLLLVAIILSVLFTEGHGLKCYKCHHSSEENNKNCLDVRNITDVSCTGKCFYLDLIGTNGSTGAVERGCLSPSGHGSALAYTCFNKAKCFKNFGVCQEDGCNGLLSFGQETRQACGDNGDDNGSFDTGTRTEDGECPPGYKCVKNEAYKVRDEAIHVLCPSNSSERECTIDLMEYDGHCVPCCKRQSRMDTVGVMQYGNCVQCGSSRIFASVLLICAMVMFLIQ